MTWLSIAVIHIRFRMAFKVQGKSLKDLVFKSPLYPFGPISALIIGTFILLGQGWAAYQVSYAKFLITFGKNRLNSRSWYTPLSFFLFLFQMGVWD